MLKYKTLSFDKNSREIITEEICSEDQRSIDLVDETKKSFNEMVLCQFDSSGKIRNDNAREYKGFIGILAEKWFISVTKTIFKGVNISSEKPHFENKTFMQRDVVINKNNKDISMEIRSSIPVKSTYNAIFDENSFKIIGPYKNNIKKSEYVKDIYVQILFDLHLQKNTNARTLQEQTTIALEEIFTDNLTLNENKTFAISFVGWTTGKILTQSLENPRNFQTNTPQNASRALPILQSHSPRELFRLFQQSKELHR